MKWQLASIRLNIIATVFRVLSRIDKLGLFLFAIDCKAWKSQGTFILDIPFALRLFVCLAHVFLFLPCLSLFNYPYYNPYNLYAVFRCVSFLFYLLILVPFIL